MALKISLKPHERLIIGGAVISNGATKSDLVIENNVPILREKDILGPKDADSPCKSVYLAIQLMYIDEKKLAEYHKTYWELIRDILRALPSRHELIAEISEHILHSQYYQALKLTKKLIEYEQEVLNHARNTSRRL
ncbi:MAG: flagellar biosynthesis repressor FlbT [Nitrospirae bacterium]|nr:flagellar biosynthesis repressor FlbT [Nitrospirota bacterium]